MNQVLPSPRRCRSCGARAEGPACPECGSKIAQLQEIGVLNGVNNNFGTVNNVYNMSLPPQEPEFVDLQEVQDGLNERFPDRVPRRHLLGEGVVRKTNKAAYFLGAFLLVLGAASLAFFLWA